MIRPYITDVHNFCAYKYAPGEDASALLMGVELEVSVRSRLSPERVSDEVDGLLGTFCICTSDSSVYNGFEIKSAASTYKYHLTAWDAFFEWNKRKERLRESHVSCGTHITIEKNKWFKDADHAGRFACFINASGARRVVREVAEREPNNHCPYEKVNPKSVLSFNHGSHKSAVCTHKHGGRLMEVRIFQGRVNKDSLMKNLEFVMAVKDFTDTEHTKFRSAQAFLKWIRTNGNWRNYPHLYSFLKERSLIKPRPVKVKVPVASLPPRRRMVAFPSPEDENKMVSIPTELPLEASILGMGR